MTSNNSFLDVQTDETARRTVNVINPDTIKGIEVVRHRESSISDSESNLSDSSFEVKKKYKKRSKSRGYDKFTSGRTKYPSFDHSRKSKKNRDHFPREYPEYNDFANPKKMRPPQEKNYESSDYDSDSVSDSSSGSSASSNSGSSSDDNSWKKKEEEKRDLLIKIQSLERKGFKLSKTYTMKSDLSDMRFEVEKIKREVDLQGSVRFQRRCLMACITGLEFLNKKFDPFDVHLSGWSESVMENIDDYDNVFERLHDKYSDRAEMAPELELLLTLGGSAFMFHLTSTLFKAPESLSSNIGNSAFMDTIANAMKSGINPGNKNIPTHSQGPIPPTQTRNEAGYQREMSGPTIDPSLFNPHTGNFGETKIASNIPPPSDIDDDDRFSEVSTSSSDVSENNNNIISTKSINIFSKKGKKSKKGFELNLS